ncbi:MAG: hypothetical protein HY678_00685 [Chloroflexi bacterium]|nr:hypothetical protein [Chloroflexota bacterium]
MHTGVGRAVSHSFVRGLKLPAAVSLVAANLLLAACAPPPADLQSTPKAPVANETPVPVSTIAQTATPTLPPPTAFPSPTALPSPTPSPSAATTAVGSPTRAPVAPTATAPVTPAAAQAPASPTPAPTQRQTADQPDDQDGYQVHFLYVLPSDGRDEELDTNGWIATAVGSAQKWLEKETAGRRLSVDTFGGEIDITFVRLSRPDAVVSAYDSRSGTTREPLVRVTLEVELRSIGFEHPRKVYAVYYGGGSDTGECFGGSYPPSRVGNIAIANVKLGTRCEEPRKLVYADGSYAIAVANFHEIFHTLGAVARCAPHHSTESGGHVSDDPQDLMFPRSSRTVPRVDVARDDYFGHGKPACLDLARSPFLLPAPPDAELPPLWPAAVARPRACEEEPTAGATGSGPRGGIIFDNMRAATMQVFQLTPEGRTLRDTVRPWTASYQQGAQTGSAWLVADANGKCLAIFVSESTLTRASVRGGG